jgi:hypothetical protein
MLRYTLTRTWSRILTAFVLLTTVFSGADVSCNPIGLVVGKSISSGPRASAACEDFIGQLRAKRGLGAWLSSGIARLDGTNFGRLRRDIPGRPVRKGHS